MTLEFFQEFSGTPKAYATKEKQINKLHFIKIKISGSSFQTSLYKILVKNSGSPGIPLLGKLKRIENWYSNIHVHI